MHEQASDKTYFESPQDAVPKIAELLLKEDFGTLSKYYDLSNSDISLSDLQSGEFFIRTERPELAHPAGFWRYKHPFAPGFEYSSMWSGARANVYVVKVMVSIDQGADSPVQQGYSLFHMIQSDKGWQLLPDHVVDP